MRVGLSFLAVLFIVGCTAQCSICTGCGNGKCEYPAESCASCPMDCGACPPCTLLCGNFRCDADKGENSCNCPKDCGPCCEDGVCRQDMGETFYNCPADCAVPLAGVTVEDITLAPLSNINVLCFSRDRTWPIINTGISSNEFRIESVPQDTYTCLGTDPTGMYAPGYANFTLDTVSINQTVVIPMRKQFCNIMGVVYDNSTDEAIRGALVDCGPTTVDRITSPMGLYFFVNFEPSTGLQRCVATKEGYRDADCFVECGPSKTVECPIPMEPKPGTIIGNVVDITSGRSITSTVTCIFIDGTSGSVPSNDTASSGGNTYILDEPQFVILPGKISCTAEKSRYKAQTISKRVERGTTVRFDFQLDPEPSTLSGNLFDGSIIPQGPVSPAFTPKVVCETVQLDGTTLTVQSTPLISGGWAFTSLKPGNYSCDCRANDYYSSAIFEQVVTAGEDFGPVTCIVQPIPAFFHVLPQTPSGEYLEGVIAGGFASGVFIGFGASTPEEAPMIFGPVTAFGGNVEIQGGKEGFLGNFINNSYTRNRNYTYPFVLRPNVLVVETRDAEFNTPLIGVSISANIGVASFNCATNRQANTSLVGGIATTRPEFYAICFDDLVNYTVVATKPLYDPATVPDVKLIEGGEVVVRVSLNPSSYDFPILITESALRLPDGSIRYGQCPPYANTGGVGFCKPLVGVNVEIWSTTGICAGTAALAWSSRNPVCRRYNNVSSATGYVTPRLVPNRNYFVNLTLDSYADSPFTQYFNFSDTLRTPPSLHFMMDGKDATIQGCVKNVAGDPIDRATITRVDLFDMTTAFIQSDQLMEECNLQSGTNCASLKGCYRFRNTILQRVEIGPGYTIRVTDAEGTINPQPSVNVTVIDAGRVYEVNVTANQVITGDLRGFVDANPLLLTGVVDVDVVCTGTGGRALGTAPISRLTSAPGNFTMNGILIGDYTCTFSKSGFKSTTRTAKVTAGLISPQLEVSILPPNARVGKGYIHDICGNILGSLVTDPFAAAVGASFECHVYPATTAAGIAPFGGIWNGVQGINALASTPPTGQCAAPCVEYREASNQIGTIDYVPSTGVAWDAGGPATAFISPTDPAADLFWIECWWTGLEDAAITAGSPDRYTIREWDPITSTTVSKAWLLPRTLIEFSDMVDDPTSANGANFDKVFDWNMTVTGYPDEVLVCP